MVPMSENLPADETATTEATETTTPTSDAPEVQEASSEATETVEATEADQETDAASEDKSDEPPSYDSLKLPEEFEINAERFAAFKETLAGEGVSSETAQALVDMHISEMQAAADVWSDTVKEWGEQIKADKEFGGRKLEATRTHAAEAIAKFGTPELRAYFDQSGLGNHPELVKTFSRIGEVLSEATTEPAGGASADPLAALYPTMNR